MSFLRPSLPNNNSVTLSDDQRHACKKIEDNSHTLSRRSTIRGWAQNVPGVKVIPVLFNHPLNLINPIERLKDQAEVKMPTF